MLLMNILFNIYVYIHEHMYILHVLILEASCAEMYIFPSYRYVLLQLHSLFVFAYTCSVIFHFRPCTWTPLSTDVARLKSSFIVCAFRYAEMYCYVCIYVFSYNELSSVFLDLVNLPVSPFCPGDSSAMLPKKMNLLINSLIKS